MSGARTVALALTACAAGCFSDRGLAIEVDVGDTGATTVELYIARHRCGESDNTDVDCTGIAPPDGTGRSQRIGA